MRQISTLFLLLTAITLGLSPAARADVTSVTSSPASLRINADGVTSVRVRWTVSLLNSLPVTVSSASGQLLDGAAVVATPGGSLSRSVTAVGPSTVQFSESFVINRTLAKTLLAGGTITYRRTFTDGPTTAVASLPVVLSGNAQIAFSYVALRLDTGGTYDVVQTGAPLSAEALLTLSGNGVLDAVWEVAELSAASPNSFRPLQRIRRAVGGRRQMALTSPPLPTLRPGLYALRLRPLGEPAAVTDLFPVIRYAVVSGDDATGQLRLTRPEAGARFGTGTVFGWTAAPGAASYRVEFLAQGRPVAGIAVAAPDLSAQVKSFTLAKAKSEQATHWRVVAFDGEGRVIAAAPARRLTGGTDQTGSGR